MRTCEYCGKPLAEHQQAYCSPQCEVLARAAITREALDSRRVKRTPVHSLIEKQCIDCGKTFLGGCRALRCPDCKIIAMKMASACAWHRRRSGETRHIGSTDLCKVCGKPYTVHSGAQKMCPDCAYQQKLELQRELYQKNAETLRKKRKELYRQASPDRTALRTCAICGKPVDPATRRMRYCSDACAKEARTQQIRTWFENGGLQNGKKRQSVVSAADGAAFAARRIAAGFSQLGIAKAAGVCGTTVSKYERGASVAQSSVAALEDALRKHESAQQGKDGKSDLVVRAAIANMGPSVYANFSIAAEQNERLNAMCNKLLIPRSRYICRAIESLLQNPEPLEGQHIAGKKTKFNTPLPNDLLQQVAARCSSSGTSRSAFIRHAIDLQLTRDEELFSAKKADE